VIRIGGAGEVRLVAGVAIGRCPRENAIDVAAGAGHRRMRSRQRERGVVVVKRRPGPGSRGMAGLACGWESRRNVCRIRSAGEIGGVARIAVRRRARKHTVNVATRAWCRDVCPGQWELCIRIVVELDISPVHSRVADGAIVGETGLGVIRICR